MNPPAQERKDETTSGTNQLPTDPFQGEAVWRNRGRSQEGGVHVRREGLAKTSEVALAQYCIRHSNPASPVSGETESGEVGAYLESVSEQKVRGYLNIISLTELHHILRRRSGSVAEEKERNLLCFGVRTIPVIHNSPLWKKAAAKAGNALSLADAFAVSTALLHKCTLVTGSTVEFEQAKDLKIECVGGNRKAE
ncbi:MAG: PIN domain-containing protein [Nitrososphaerota archaeon]|nr:PIN domain-containing protein [Nitrososphaerota archaeon]MDG6975788.1 PIN domain-containing protein [Nitrososphaerota archaeon]